MSYVLCLITTPVTRKASVLDKGVLTLMAYNALAQLETVRMVAGGQTNTVTMTYDALGNLLSRTDAEGRTQRMVLDTLGRVTGMVDALMQTNRVEYTPFGQVDTLLDANGNRTAWDFDPLGQLLTKTYDDGTKVSYTYDALGRLQSRLDAKGGYLTYQYDALGHLTTNLFYAATNAPAPVRAVAYAYDALGRLTNCNDGVAVKTVVYDDAAFTRTVTADYGDGHSMTSVYRYDPVAREMICDFGGVTNVYRYDADGKLLAVSIPGEGWATYSYNTLGQNDTITLPGGTKRILVYDAFGRLSGQSAQDSGGNALLSQAYQRSLTGRLETKSTGAGVWHYGYDLTDQVTNAVLSASASDGAWGYSYDAMGNRSQSAVAVGSGNPDITTYAANRLNQYAAITNSATSASPREISPKYDLNGNMTWDGTNTYFWDLQNQLVLVSNAEVLVSNAYDAMGRRVKKIVSRKDAETQNWEVERTHYFFYDGWNLVRETVQLNSLTPPNSLTNYYTWGTDLSGSLQGAGGVGGLLAVSVSNPGTLEPLNPETFYSLYDHNGNVERYVARNGVTVASFQYDAFGNTVAQSGPMADAFAYRFSTKYWDVEVGLYYYGYRYYAPRLGRWINRDPIGENGGGNLYVVVHNRPIDRRDPLGLTNAPGDFGWGWYNPNFFPPPPDPSITRPRLGDFHHHGNWGGPGWAAGGWHPEENLKESDFEDPRYAPIDDRDKCYLVHDKCIWKCHRDPCNNNDDKLNECIRSCDYTLAGCLYNLPRYKPSFYVTSVGFPVRADIEAVGFLVHFPFLVHGGLQSLF